MFKSNVFKNHESHECLLYVLDRSNNFAEDSNIPSNQGPKYKKKQTDITLIKCPSHMFKSPDYLESINLVRVSATTWRKLRICKITLSKLVTLHASEL